MVTKRRNAEAPADTPKRVKEEEPVGDNNHAEEPAEDNNLTDEEEKLDDDDKEEMQVVDEAKDDDEDTKEEETVFSMEMPGDVEGISGEAVRVTMKTLSRESRRKYAVVKYVEAAERIHQILTDIYPDVDREGVEASLKALKDLNDEVSKVDSSKVKLSEETKKAFAYHVEICKKGMPEIYQETAEDKDEETQVQKLFKKAPKLSADKVNDVVKKGEKLLKEKKKLLDELNDLNVKMQIVDTALCSLLVESNSEERQGWQFFQENSDKILEVFDLLSGPELVILEMCKDIGNKVLEKMAVCRKNWTNIGTQLTEKCATVSNLVNGPLVTSEQLAEKKNLERSAPESRSSLLDVLHGIRKKVANNVVTEYIKKQMSTEDEASYNYLVNDLETLVGKQRGRLQKEEKLYIGYHLSKIKPYVNKITDLHSSKSILEGTYSFHKSDGRRSDEERRRGDYRSERYSRERYSRDRHSDSDRYSSDKHRRRSPERRTNFNHHGAY